jgi:hypothetical protein
MSIRSQPRARERLAKSSEETKGRDYLRSTVIDIPLSPHDELPFCFSNPPGRSAGAILQFLCSAMQFPAISRNLLYYDARPTRGLWLRS